MASPLKKIEKAHQMYRDGLYEGALGFYTEALSMAKTNPQRIALHSNRAACYLKLHHFKKAAEECTSVLDLDRDHTGALMLRAQTLVTLKEYNSAFFDVNRLMELNPSSEVYRSFEARLRTQLLLAPIPESEAEEEEEKEEAEESVVMDGEAEITVSAFLESDKENNSDNDTSASVYVDDFSTEAALEKPYCDQANDVQKNKAQAVSLAAPAPQLEEAQKKNMIMKDKTLSDNGWQAIPKPKGHSALDYGRWDCVEDNSSEDDSDEEDEEECLPQYRFRVRTVGVRPVK